MASAAPSSSKRKAPEAPMSVVAGIQSTERAGQAGGAPTTAKRARKVGAEDEEEDVAGDLDIAEQDRKRLQQGRKGRVMTDGYDSDDSDESGEDDGDDAAPGEGGKRNGKVAGVDEDDDMFEISDEGDDKPKKAGKGKKYLELKEIEGQEFSEHGGSDDDRDKELELESDEDAGGDEEEGEQLHDPDAVVKPLRKPKKKADAADMTDMGFQIDSFNMKSEMAAGRFDEDGNYTANAKDPHAEHDKWLTGNYSKKGIQAAKVAKMKREREARQREQKRDNAHLDEDECRMRLVGLLRRGETVLQALQRFGAQSKKAHTRTSKQTLSNGDDGAAAARTIKAELEQITSLTSELMSRHGQVNIYDETYEGLLDEVRKSGLVRSTWDPAGDFNELNAKPDADRTFTYKWSPSYLGAMAQTGQQQQQQEQQVFGPFVAADLRAWKDSGYFGDAGERIVLRASDGTAGDVWGTWADVMK